LNASNPRPASKARQAGAAPLPTSAREAAFQILLRVDTAASFATDLLNGPLTALLSERDAGLCTELVMGTLRWQARLDFLLGRFADRPLQDLDPEVRVALRLGAYQLAFLCTPGRMPARAALYETVDVVKRSAKRSASGFVNAVLRRCAGLDAPQNLAPLRPAGISEMEWLAIEYSHPAWLLDRWMSRLGRTEALELAVANNQAPTTFLRFRSGQSEGEGGQQISTELKLGPGNLLKSCRAVEAGNPARSAACKSGDIVIQDEASQIVPYLLDVQPGHQVLDLCAAPGNKTSQLAEFAEPGIVIACDVHLHRLAQMAGTRESLHAARVVLDGTGPLPFHTQFDRILVDAPCSGTGTLRRHPEMKWRLSASDLESLSSKQSQLLENAAPMLRAGGRLVYSTCALEPEENRQVVGRFIDSHPEFRVLSLAEDSSRLRPFFHDSALDFLERNFMETLPSRDGTDGFFAVILIKKAAASGI
jgi:16S rRNA (cytosine967-C5)-methyltransferase